MSSQRETNNALHDNIELLVDLLCQTLKKQEGMSFLDTIKQILDFAKEYKTDPSGAISQVHQTIQNLDNDKILPTTRAFSHFLNLTDIAEQYHRIRRRRWHQRAESLAQPGSLEAVLPDLIRKGIAQQALNQAVADLNIELVLTAHPTEVTRRTLIRKYNRIANGLEQLDREDLTPHERELVIDDLQREITSAWQTDEIRRQKPTAVEEAKWGFAVIEESLWNAIPKFMKDLNQILLQLTDEGLKPGAIPIRLASWMGGDRDGNSNVTAAVTREVILMARWKAAELYLRDIEVLNDALSMNVCSPELREVVGESAEPYRTLLQMIKERLLSTQYWAESRLQGNEDLALALTAAVPIYLDPEDLRKPLMICYRSLQNQGANDVATGYLSDVLYRVGCFGLTLLPLDLRQDANKHIDLMDALTQKLDFGSYREWSEEKRQLFLLDRLAQTDTVWIPEDLNLEPESQEYLDTFRVIVNEPRDSFGAYVISMASKPSDILLVLALQKAVGVKEPLRVVPLFETLKDLNQAAACMDELFSLNGYKSACHGLQEVMIGYSDSAKDAGILAASWAQFQAQEALLAVARSHQIRIVFFHGRGGSAGRGGGPTHLAIRSQPPGTIQGCLRVTQQGEIIRHRFGMQKIAERTLAIYVTATLEATLLPSAPPKVDWRLLMDRLSANSLKIYQDLVKETPDFNLYFRAATPIKELDKITIGSRPARRKVDGGIENLRAIPWVFAWTQNRLLLPAWYGVGEALMEITQTEAWESLNDASNQWLYLASLFNMVEMVIAKADPNISAQYESHLVPEVLWSLGKGLRGSFTKTKECLLKILRNTELLKNNPILDRSISVRNPYLLALHLLQIELLERYRVESSEINQSVEHALLVSISGIAAGMHNTG